MAEFTNDTFWTLLHYGIEDKFGTKYYADLASRVTSFPGDPFCGLSCSVIAAFDSYYDFIADPIDIVLWIPKVQHLEYIDGGTPKSYDIDQVKYEKPANTSIGLLKFYYQGVMQTQFYMDQNFELAKTIVGGVPVYDTGVYINLVCYELAGVKHAGISTTCEISAYNKGNYSELVPFDFGYSTTSSTFIEAFLDAQLNGVYWDSSGNAGPPADQGGGVGDLRRPDYEIGIPSLPSLSACDTGFVGIYEVDSAQIQALAADLWSNNFYNSIIKNFRSPFDNIISLSIVPFDGFTGALDNIMIGNYQSSAAGNKLSTTFYEIDCGVVDITPFYDTYADYAPYTKIQLYLPMCTTIEINPDDCMGGKIHVVYHFDIFSGACVAYVQTIVDGAWHVLYSVEGNIKAELPINGQNFLTVYTGAMKTALAAASGNVGGMIDGLTQIKPTYQRAGGISGTSGLLAIQYPYLIFSTPQVFVPDNFKELKGYVSNLKCTIGSQTGFLSAEVSADDLIDFDCTDEELIMVADKLKEGIRLGSGGA